MTDLDKRRYLFQARRYVEAKYGLSTLQKILPKLQSIVKDFHMVPEFQNLRSRKLIDSLIQEVIEI